MREHQAQHPEQIRGNDVVIQYADDAQYCLHCGNTTVRHVEVRIEGCECGQCRAEMIQQSLPTTMLNSNMQMNPGKTKRSEMIKESKPSQNSSY